MTRLRGRLVFALGASGLLGAGAMAAAAPLTVLILAGQSDILNWHADAALLPAGPADSEIRFYYHTGAPPLHPQFPRNFFNATSRDAWTTLRPQTQEPYHKFFRTFFGPEMTLGRRLSTLGVGPLAIIKIGYFGTNLAEDWRPEASAGNQLYALFRQQVTTALAHLRDERREFHVAGFFWMQGGGDAATAAFAARYEENLVRLIDRMRADFGTAGTPFVIGRIPRIANAPHRETVRAAHVKLGTTLPGVTWVDSDDLPGDTDGVHLLAPGIITLGERMAAAWLTLAGSRR
ncbi:MAG: hypothetical protein RL077_5965 [Verrucomicrobiota bacterium]